MISYLRLFLAGLFLVGHAVLLHFCIQIPLLVCHKLFLDRDTYHAWGQEALKVWGQVSVVFIKWFCPVSIYMSGDYIFPQENAIVLCNHLTYADWMWLWLLAHHNDRLKGIKIILKESPKYIPIFGWAMVLFEFIFLKRKWVEDQLVLKSTLQNTKNYHNMWLMLFPEGTILAEDTVAKSNAFCKANQLVPIFHVVPARADISP